ncbi:hypothetical protein RND71_023029 [Anisodus tanguticus]|uniref:Mitochondrial processing peptidase alpha subunit n=1 Tax=Anisodus tanguticus TaxID=243964 RepID=A0AAE1RRW2_9SOLA|nr:hypothetical protein RND71_023029 [Anisodus tanguticus]
MNAYTHSSHPPHIHHVQSRIKVRGGSRVLARFSSSTAVATKPSGGLFSWLTGDGSDSLPPLDFPLKNVQLPPPLPDYVEPGKTKITTLTNGLKIASETSALEKVKAEIDEYSKNPQHFLLKAVHSASYSGPYGTSLAATVNRLNSIVLEEFVAENYTARIVLSASGVEHEELLKVAEPLLSDLPKMTHLALAFEVPGGWLRKRTQ